MTRLRTPAALAALLLAVSCGKSAEEKRMDAFKASCLALTGQTLDQAIRTFSLNPGVDCVTPSVTHLSGSTCPYDTQYVCRAFFASCANDLGLCGPPPLGGCLYFCEVQFPGVQYAVGVDATTAVICGERFVSGQPGYFNGCLQ